MTAPTFECRWCRESEEIAASLKTDSVHELADLMDEEEYVYPLTDFGGYDKESGEPICQNTARMRRQRKNSEKTNGQ